MRGLLLAGVTIFGASSLAMVTSASVVPALHAGYSATGSGNVVVSEREIVAKILGTVNTRLASSGSDHSAAPSNADVGSIYQHHLLVTEIPSEVAVGSTDLAAWNRNVGSTNLARDDMTLATFVDIAAAITEAHKAASSTLLGMDQSWHRNRP